MTSSTRSKQAALPNEAPDAVPAIEVTGLTKVYGAPEVSAWKRLLGARPGTGEGTRPAADDVNFSVAQGEFFVIMGLSGSGKSTVLRMLNRLVEPTSGKLVIGGRDVAALSADELRDLRNRKINMVFQHFALFPHRTVRENAAYALHVRGVSAKEQQERVDWALETVGLGEWGEALPGELSGGMRQRVGLARALASDADILLMDEPFSALDPLIRRDMQDLLMTLQRELKRTVVFVTHDLNEAMRMGDRVMIMRDGQVVQLGTAQEILNTPADGYVSDFVSDVDRTRVLTAGDVMREPLFTVTEQDAPKDVLRRLSNVEGVGTYVLDSASRRIIGVARADRLAKALGQGKTALADCITKDYDSFAEDVPLADLFHVAGRNSVPLAVTDAEGHLLGVIPQATLLAALATPESATGNDESRKDDAHA
ncbi:quaternary amine ABC transporter ATP-binding protein [Kineosporia babensis]|uniref:Betaine/proline/choline family ABC transporter ATP-binding protein n=1 Tax=Kineosporia babensis TaxID=499548 RepID=A0A9X1NNQ8_9ACTN|nr:betaine/proline/choline family ABC transporter ATP-binding protein [Kineosporia babensis]MCD5316506.1 betaine/proline/choline family ABC transporter ATP-binding protein [Kineosporia babensis]